MPSDGLSKTINGRMYARGSEREVAIESGGSSSLLGASQDQQCFSQHITQGVNHFRRSHGYVSAYDPKSQDIDRSNTTIVSGK